MKEGPKQGVKRSSAVDDLHMDDFYKVMGEFYGSVKRHTSPTKRLRDMKDSTVVHKTVLKQGLRRTQDYSLTYCTSPDKAYVIEPHSGEIDYELAYKNPLKFMDKVIGENVTKHKVGQNKEMKQAQELKIKMALAMGGKSPKKKKIPLQLTSKETKRKAGRIFASINVAIFKLLRKHSSLKDDELKKAMQSKPVIEQVRKSMVTGDIGLVDKDGTPLYSR